VPGGGLDELPRRGATIESQVACRCGGKAAKGESKPGAGYRFRQPPSPAGQH